MKLFILPYLMNHKYFLFIPLFVITIMVNAQQSLYNLNDQLQRGRYEREVSNSYYLMNDSSDGLNYAAPLVNYYANKGSGSLFDNGTGIFSQMFSTTGNYYEAFSFFKFADKNTRTDSTIQGKLKSVFPNTIEYIVANSRKTQVTMINEAHDWAQCRVFIIKLLPELRKAGYKYLAMEALSPAAAAKSLSSLDYLTGSYTSEPVFGELVRYALELGYELVPYEHYSSSDFDFSDTISFKKFLNERDSMQAVNLSGFIEKHNDGKLLVVAGYAHIDEAVSPGPPGHFSPFVPMAFYFKAITGIDPFTVNQTLFSESSPFAEEYKGILQALNPQTPQYTPVNPSASFAMPGAANLNDIYIVHPKTKFINHRPQWLELNGLRKRYVLKLPEEVMDALVLLQAYYQKEADSDNINYKIPADQFMLMNSNEIDFYLRPGFSYYIICRDINNKIIYKMNYEAM